MKSEEVAGVSPTGIRAGSIYTITCVANGRVYVGSTVRATRQRWLEHLHYLRKGTHHSRHMQKVFAKYGESAMRFDVIENVEDRLFLEAREQFQMWRHAGRLMNGKAVVDQPIQFTAEVRAKMSARRRARPGVACSAETKAKIAIANAGKKRTPDQIARNVASKRAWIETERDSWLGMIKQGMSYRAVEKATGRSRDVISRECRGLI